MNNEDGNNESKVKADNNGIAIGGINIGGDVTGTIQIGHTTGYTADQVSVLIAQIQSTFHPKPFDGRCPYKGLDVFEEDDAELFFGREKLVEDLVNRVKDSRTVFVTGPSGSGKSSLVRAGLIHALKQGAIIGSDRWLYATMKPGRDPIGELGRVASSLASSTNPEDEIRIKAMKDATIFARWCEIALKEGRDKRIILFIDQFEEVFTQISKEEERVAFLNLLTHAATIANGRVIILFSMRSDFVSNCATYPQLNSLLNQQFVQIGAMQSEELVSAIAQPALRVGLRIDPDLIAQIINEMKGEPGALPLMQFTLKDLFDFQAEKSGVIALTLNDYLQRGGIHKALERHADDSFSKLSNHEQELARSIFSGLIEIGRGTQDTKRTALFDELVPANTKALEVETIVQKLADARLITTDEQGGKETVTISHEKLIDAWPWLKKLVNENRDVIALQNEISGDAKEWDDHQHDDNYLYRGGRLATAEEKIKKLMLSENAKAFLKAGVIFRNKEQRERERRLRWTVFASIATAVIFLVLGSFGLVKSNEATARANDASTAQANAEEQKLDAQKQAYIAQANQLAAISQAKLSSQLDLASLLSIEAFRELDNFQTRSALLNALQTSPNLHQYLYGHNNSVTSVAFSPDGKYLVSGGWDNTVILWDLKTERPIGHPLKGHSGFVISVTFSPDGKSFASGGVDKTIIIWDVKTLQPVGEPIKEGSTVVSLAFSPNGKSLASGNADNTIILWNVATRQPIGQPLKGHTDIVSSVTFSPDGKLLASGSWDNSIILWNAETSQPISQPLKQHKQRVLSIAFNFDGSILASGGEDNIIILWDVKKLQPIDQSMRGHVSAVTSLAFSPDGKTLASGSRDSTIILWDVETHQYVGIPLRGHSNFVWTIAFSSDGKTLASGGSDNTIILWNLENNSYVYQPLKRHENAVLSVAFSPDGKTLASGSFDKTVILWNVETRQPIGQPLKGHSRFVLSVAFSPDGRILASGSVDKTIILWDVETHQPIGQPLNGHSIDVESVAFSPDGKTLASGSCATIANNKCIKGEIILWDVQTREPIGQSIISGNGIVIDIAFSPDGKILAAANDDSTIILWDVETHKQIGQTLKGHIYGIGSIGFSPDGKLLASGSADTTIIFWDVATQQPIGQPLNGNNTVVESVAFSPDGKTLASGNDNGTIILWDVETHQSIGQPLSGHSSAIYSVVFSPNGMMLASGSHDKTVLLWDMNPQSWIEKSCQRANRNLTRIEWNQYIGDALPYQAVCPNFPIEAEVTPIPAPTSTP